MRDDLLLETERLTRSWAHHEASWLREYLVAGVEDPRLNMQSILTRHFIIRSFAGDKFERFMTQECRFAATARWLLDNFGLLEDPDTCAAVLDALRRGADNAEGIQIPPFISITFNSLTADRQSPLPSYLEQFLVATGDPKKASLDSAIDTFAKVWRELLSQTRPDSELGNGESRPPFTEKTGDVAATQQSVLEPACGSANDFRFLHHYGIARFVDYTGFDLCSANVENAHALFPEVRFEHGNVFDIQAADKAFDICIVHDLFEHFSLAGLEQAVKEVCRVTRKGICVGFFQMDEIAQHVVRPVDDYHWNLLSMSRTKDLFNRQGFAAQVIHIDTFLAEHTANAKTHNPNAYTFVLQRS